MSSHREAPEISKDPVADNTDVYAFRSPDAPNTVTLIANYLPGEAPAGGPNFYEFGDDVRYSIHIDNDGDGEEDISYVFEFKNVVTNPDTFLYNTGPITALNSDTWNVRQFYSVTRVDYGKKGKKPKSKVLAPKVPSPPCNIGPRSTPDYGSLANAAVRNLKSGETVFAGQRREGFYVDLGSIFDLGTLRPLQNLHLIATDPAMAVDATAKLNVHTIAIQVPISKLTRDGSRPTDVMSKKSVIGVWGAASRRKSKVYDPGKKERSASGPWVQVSRLGNPLFNEVIVPVGRKDEWNGLPPAKDKRFQKYVEGPELAKLLPVLYPGAFPNLQGLSAKRADLVAILLTGIPEGIIPGFQNFTTTVPSDMLRLNMAIPPTTNDPSPLGLLGNDAAGFPNGRRVADDVVNIELRAVAGATYPLIDPGYTPDDAVGAITQGVTPGPDRYQATFPYLGAPLDGYSVPAAA